MAFRMLLRLEKDCLTIMQETVEKCCSGCAGIQTNENMDRLGRIDSFWSRLK
jgi:hypothetical protein